MRVRACSAGEDAMAHGLHDEPARQPRQWPGCAACGGGRGALTPARTVRCGNIRMQSDAVGKARGVTSLATPPETDQLDVLDPTTGERIGTIPAGSADAAVRAARAAAPAWARTAPADRAAALKAGARRLREHAAELAELQTREGGKPPADSLGGVEAGIGAIEQYAELGPLHRRRSLAGGWGAADLMGHEPRGGGAPLGPGDGPGAVARGPDARPPG